jgi:hypothetical protein
MKTPNYKSPICVAGKHLAAPEDLKATLVGHICTQHAALCVQATAAANQIIPSIGHIGSSGIIRKTTQALMAHALEIEGEQTKSEQLTQAS